MDSNYNVLLLSIECDGKYKIGDVFYHQKPSNITNLKLLKFEGLKIRNIDYNFGVRLHFDFNEWEKAEIKVPQKIKNKNIKFFYFFF